MNQSDWNNRLERRADGRLALRLGFRQIKGFRAEDAGWIVAARGNGYPDVESLWLRAGLLSATLERLAEADAFAGLGLTRRDALWAVRAIRAPKPLPLFANPLDGEGGIEPAVHRAPAALKSRKTRARHHQQGPSVFAPPPGRSVTQQGQPGQVHPAHLQREQRFLQAAACVGRVPFHLATKAASP